jgi:hypothetical protein
MYSTGAYFISMWAACTINYLIFQPVIYATFSFIYVDFEDSSLGNYLNWLSLLMIQGINGSTFGFMFGVIVQDPINCIMIAYMGLVLIYFGGGAFTNYQGEENFVQSFF